MRLPSFIRIFQNDYPTQYADLMNSLANTLNSNQESVYDALNNNLTLSENLLSIILDLTVVVDSNGVPTSLTQFSLGNPAKFNKIEGVQVLNAKNTTNSSIYPSAQPFLTYTQSSTGAVVVNNVAGLLPNYTWTLHLVIYGASQ